MRPAIVYTSSVAIWVLRLLAGIVACLTTYRRRGMVDALNQAGVLVFLVTVSIVLASLLRRWVS
jgi:hypothetical protein